jgi:hypothetical protein
MMNKSYEFKIGEKKYIVSHIQPKNENEVVIITAAKYTLSRRGEVIEQGELTQDGRTLSYLFSAENAGEYTLTESVTIGAETFVEAARIAVR